MDTREHLLSSVRRNQPALRDLPGVPAFHRTAEPLISAFERSLKYMAGELVEHPPSDFAAYLRQKFPQAKKHLFGRARILRDQKTGTLQQLVGCRAY